MKLTRAQMMIGGGLLLALAAAWLFQPGNAKKLGAALGGAAVDTVVGAASGAAGAVADAANNPDVNPLQPVGSWIGGTIYDLTHW